MKKVANRFELAYRLEKFDYHRFMTYTQLSNTIPKKELIELCEKVGVSIYE